MHFEERNVGDYRIYAGALEAPHNAGYVAAVVVRRVQGVNEPRDVWRDLSMSGGHRWRTPQDALRHAMSKARDMIAHEDDRQAA